MAYEEDKEVDWSGVAKRDTKKSTRYSLPPLVNLLKPVDVLELIEQDRYGN